MEILLTEAFLEQARKEPDHWSARVRELAGRGGEAGPRAELLDGRIVGWAREEERLELWYAVRGEIARIPAQEPPLAALSRGELRELGLRDEQLPAARRVLCLDELEALGLPKPLERRLAFVFVQQLMGAPATREALRRRATSVGHLDRFLHGDLTDLLLHLEPGQRHIVELAGSGTVVVRGVAGSGKTAVILHRIYGLLGQRSLLEQPRVLLLTFNRALASAGLELLVALGLRADELEVSTFHRWCQQYAQAPEAILEPRERRALVAQAREAVQAEARESRLWLQPPEFWEEELHRIKGRAIAGREEYLGLQRQGAGRGLDQGQRELVWAVHERYCASLRERGRVDWDDVVLRAGARLAEQGEAAPRYDHVFVDEAQDLTVASLRLAASLARPNGSLLIAYDAAQSIYERGFRWRDCGISVHSSRSFDLKRNYRNSEALLRAARPLLAGMGQAKEDEGLLEPEQAARAGSAPRLLETGRGEECAAAAAEIRVLIERRGVPPQNVAVLCFPNAVRERMAEALAAVGVGCQKHGSDRGIRLADPSVKVLPVKSAKGLEFPVVYLLASAGSWRRLAAVDGGEELRRILYMAMTRAMSELVVVHERGALLAPLAHLGASGVETGE